nr:AsmA family protein [Nitrospirales bacterium]
MIVGLCLLTGLLALIAVLPFIVDWNRYRDHYLPILENAIGRKITVGDVRLRFFPVLRLHVEDIRIADDPAFREAPFLVVPKAEATISWKSLLQRQIKVEHMLV